MGDAIFGYREFAENLLEKLGNAEFLTDLDQLTVDTASGYDVVLAADLVMERLGSKLPGAPDIQEIQNGGWRS